ncbi:MAG: CBS and ACT domain-containing protein [Actinomycetia bacterium]|nr:CBS and ACT domain-containing protein [Actinomycetes bacterium]
MFVRTRMTANPFTVTPKTTVPEAIALLREHAIRNLPVIENGRLVGLVGNHEIAAASPSPATSLAAGEITYLMNKLQVGKIMKKDPITISPDALLEEAAILMRDNKVEMLPVVENDQVIGVITESAIFDAFIEILGFRDHGTRLTLDAVDAPGVMAQLAETTARHGANIQHMAVYRGQDRASVIFGVNTPNTDALEADLAKDGFTVQAKLVNP